MIEDEIIIKAWLEIIDIHVAIFVTDLQRGKLMLNQLYV